MFGANRRVARRTARRVSRRQMAMQGAYEPEPEYEAPPQAPPAGPDITDELKKLADLHSQGVLSDEEFAAAKSKLLGI
jgi:Short C-terminal domain